MTETETAYTREHRPPIVSGPTWLAVVARAGYQCQCTGGCGLTHGLAAGGCQNDGSIHQLAVAPADPDRDVRACLVNSAQLRAWCGPCLDAMIRAARGASLVNASESSAWRGNAEDIPALVLLIDEASSVVPSAVAAGEHGQLVRMIIGGTGSGKSNAYPVKAAGWSA